MIRGSLSRLTTGTGSAAPALEIIAGVKPIWLRRLTYTLAAATASTFAIGRPAAKGVTPTTPVAFLVHGSSDVLLATIALAWATPPTAPTQFYRQYQHPATQGHNLSDVDPGGDLMSLYIPANASLVLWNLAVNSAVYANVTVDEVQ